jgi:hypothetical protein
MHERVQSHFAALQKSLAGTGIAEPRLRLVSDAIEKLPGLYSLYRETNSSRFGDEISRLIQSILREMIADPQARKQEADFREGLHDLHEELGIPKLSLKAPPIVKGKKTAKS